MRKQVELHNDEGRADGLKVAASRRGLEVYGWFDNCAGLNSVTIPWKKVDEARTQVNPKGAAAPKGGAQGER